MWFGSPTRKLKPHSAIKVLASLEGQWDGEPRGQGGEKQGKKSLLPPTLVGKGVYRREAWDRHWPVGSTDGQRVRKESSPGAALESKAVLGSSSENSVLSLFGATQILSS